MSVFIWSLWRPTIASMDKSLLQNSGEKESSLGLLGFMEMEEAPFRKLQNRLGLWKVRSLGKA